MNAYLKLLTDCFPSLLSGLKLTMIMALFSILFASIIGILFGLFSISKFHVLRAIANVYIYIIRGIPLMIVGLFLYFGVGAILHVRFNPMIAAIIALSVNESAYMAEIFRGGMQAVDVGQFEASRSLGLSYMGSMRKVILPQAVKIMIPSIINQFITTIKDTSILSVISVRELTMSGEIIIARNYMPFQVYSYIAVMYLVVITLLSLISKWIERRLNYGHKSK